MSDPATNGGVPPRPRKPLEVGRPGDADVAASRLGVGLVWLGGIATVSAVAFFSLALLGPLVIPPLCVLLYVLLHYFLWGRWLGPRLRALAEQRERGEP